MATDEQPPVFVYVRWFDSCLTGPETIHPDDAATVMEMESCGLFLAADKASVTIALDRSVKTRNVRCTLCIPRTNIRELRTLQPVAKPAPPADTSPAGSG